MRGSIIVIGVTLVNAVAVASEGSYNFAHVHDIRRLWRSE